MAYGSDWGSFMLTDPSDFSATPAVEPYMRGFMDPSMSWSGLGSGANDYDYSNLFGGNSNYLNFGLAPGSPGMFGEPNSSPFSGLETNVQPTGWWDTAKDLGGRALNWALSPNGQGGTNLGDLGRFGLGALAMYGNRQGQRDAQQMSEAELALRQQLGNRGLDIQDRGMGLQENQFRLGSGIDDMASKALGMQLLVNRGRMTEDQTNPWLNFMFTGREQMFGQDPVIGNAFKTNPYGSSPVGVAVGPAFRGFSEDQTPVRMADGGDVSKALQRQQYGMLGQFAPQGSPSNTEMQRYIGDMLGGFGTQPTAPIDSRMREVMSQLGQIAPQDKEAMRARGMAKGGLSLLRGGSAGQADDVNAMLSHGEYVMDADVVAALGDGNTEAGAKKLDRMRENIRKHKRSASAKKIPPPAKDPMRYMGDK